MKNLYKHVIKVNNEIERKIALEFYRQATKRPFFPDILNYPYGHFVGISKTREVCSNNLKYEYEKVVLFYDIESLLDTPARVKAFDNACRKYSLKPTVMLKPDFSHITSVPAPEVKKTPSKMLPVVTFRYPNSKTGNMERRFVRVVKADETDILGYELPPMDMEVTGTFKKFKVRKIANQVAVLVRFNH